MRIIRWVGHPSPFDDHNVRKRIEKQSLESSVALMFSEFEHNRRIAVRRGASEFYLRTEQGYSRPYQWGPMYFDVEMEEADWARLARNPMDRYMFLDVTNGVPPFRPLLSAAQWWELLQAMRATAPPRVLAEPFQKSWAP